MTTYPRTYLVSAATTTAVTVVPSSFAFATAARHNPLTVDTSTASPERAA